MKILLCSPPTLSGEKVIREGRCTQKTDFWSLNYPPLTLAQCTSVLNEVSGVEVRSFDFGTGYTFQESLDCIPKDIDLGIVNVGSPTFVNDISFCKKLKETYEIKIVLIGTHSGSTYRTVLERYHFIDYIVLAEPEFVLKELVSCLMSNESLENISGLAGKNFCNKESYPVSDLDILPYPDWSQFDLDKYIIPTSGEKFLMINPQRGCPWKCTFCTAPSFYGKKIRSKSIKYIIDEIEYNMSHYQIENFLFWSDTFTANKKFVHELCLELKKLNIKWVSNSRVDTITVDLAKSMKEAGCWLLTFGIESHNDKTLERIQKGFSNDQINGGIEAAHKAGILTVGHYILGLPGEDANDMKRTFERSKFTALDYSQFYYATPFPGTEMFEEMKRDNDLECVGNFSQEEAYSNGLVTPLALKELKKEFAYKTLFTLKTFIFFIKTIKFNNLFYILKNMVKHVKSL
tara:strand:+ start:47615 stop:48994 length:1380 start_codon:yes stop_codon:yes gene_type:complete